MRKVVKIPSLPSIMFSLNVARILAFLWKFPLLRTFEVLCRSFFYFNVFSSFALRDIQVSRVLASSQTRYLRLFTGDLTDPIPLRSAIHTQMGSFRMCSRLNSIPERYRVNGRDQIKSVNFQRSCKILVFAIDSIFR